MLTKGFHKMSKGRILTLRNFTKGHPQNETHVLNPHLKAFILTPLSALVVVTQDMQ